MAARILRKQLAILKRFLEGFDLVHLTSAKTFIAKVEPVGYEAEIQALIQEGAARSFAIYVPRGPMVRLTLDLPPGSYHVEWMDPRDGRTVRVNELGERRKDSLQVEIDSPSYREDLAIRITPSK